VRFYFIARCNKKKEKYSEIFDICLFFTNQVYSPTRVPGWAKLLGESWWQKNWGAIRGKSLHGNREIAGFWRVGCCGCIGTVDSGPECAQSWDQIQMLKNYICCHIYSIHWCTHLYRTVTVFRAVSNRQSRYPLPTRVPGLGHLVVYPKNWGAIQILHCFSSNPSNLVGRVFLCGGSWSQLQLRNEGAPPDFEFLFLEKRSIKRVSTNVLIRGEMNPLHKHKIMSIGHRVKKNLKSRSWKLV